MKDWTNLINRVINLFIDSAHESHTPQFELGAFDAEFMARLDDGIPKVLRLQFDQGINGPARVTAVACDQAPGKTGDSNSVRCFPLAEARFADPHEAHGFLQRASRRLATCQELRA